MNETKHTPGPWETCEHQKGLYPIVIRTQKIIQRYYKTGKPKGKPEKQPIVLGLVMPNDARLISAAPELLEALEKIAYWEPDAGPGEPGGMSICEAIEIAHAAIAKAQGESK